jgi:hypothetical protein
MTKAMNSLSNETEIMQSQLLLEYLRTGTIAPLKKDDTKATVEAKLGVPSDWKGRVAGIGWQGPLFIDFRESWHGTTVLFALGLPILISMACAESV